MQKIATERNLLYSYVPMDFNNRSRSFVRFPFDKNGSSIKGEFWNAKNYMLIDTICDFTWRTIYSNSLPRNKKDSKVIYFGRDFNFKYLNIPKESFIVNVPYKHLITTYPYLDKYSPIQLKELFEKISNIQIKTVYSHMKMVLVEKGIEFKKEKINIDNFNRIFELKISNIKQNKYVTDMEYNLQFTDTLGSLLYNNITLLELEWIDPVLYECSNNAQNLYRIFILNKKPLTKIEVILSELKTRLNINTKNISSCKDTIISYLNSLKSKELIEWELNGLKKDPKFTFWKTRSNVL